MVTQLGRFQVHLLQCFPGQPQRNIANPPQVRSLGASFPPDVFLLLHLVLHCRLTPTLMLLSSNFTFIPRMVLQEPFLVFLLLSLLLFFASRSVLWWLPRDSYCSRHSSSHGCLAGWFENIILEHLLSAMCTWSVTHSHPSHPPLQVPDPPVNGWWVTVCEYHDCPPSPASALNGGSNISHQVTHHSCRCTRHVQSKSAQVSIYWPLEEPATTLCTLDQNTSWSQKRGWSIWLPKRGAHLVPATQYLGIQPRRICDFSFQVLLFFPALQCLGWG